MAECKLSLLPTITYDHLRNTLWYSKGRYCILPKILHHTCFYGMLYHKNTSWTEFNGKNYKTNKLINHVYYDWLKSNNSVKWVLMIKFVQEHNI